MRSRYDDASWRPIGHTVHDASPAVPDLTDMEKDALWERIATTPHVASRSRRSWRTVVAALVATSAIGVAGVATAAVFSAHTGKGPVDAEDVELGGPGERLDPSAPDFAQVLDEISRDIRFPSAATRQKALDWEAADFPYDSGPVVSTGALRLWIAGHAVCAWTNDWAVALRAGDATGVEEAASVLRSARTWPAITDTDPEMAHQSEAAWLPDLERAVADGKPRAARAALFGNQTCMPGLAPELGMGRAQ
ncbi:hypothetical protein [Nocardioides jejuensis]|uniref:hypothetical protein n=1 Tax=Nocardioides jejuensis TaxID=2502782 RepID=UPI001405550A|nr:hypothetical protein [Nocardioides jejuensis]